MDRSIQPPVNKIKHIHICKPQETKLLGGIPTYIFQNDSNIVNIRFVFNVGSFNQDKPLQSVFTSKMMGEGTARYNSRKIANMFDFYGAKYFTETTNDHISVVLITTKKHLARLLHVFADIIQNPIFPEKELATALKISQQHFLLESEKVTYMARSKFESVLFGEQNFYGYTLKPEDFQNLDTKDLAAFHKTHFVPGNCLVIMTGNITQEDLQLIDNSFPNFDTTSRGYQHESVLFKSADTMQHKVLKPKALQSALEIGRFCPQKNDSDNIPFRILNTVLGGYFGSRLMANIREDKGYTYGIYSAVMSLRHASFFVIKTQVGADVCSNAIREIYNEITRLQNEKIQEKELNLVKNYLLGNILKSTDGYVNLSNLFASLIVYGHTLDYIEKYMNELQHIESKHLLLLAQKYFSPDSLYEVVAGK